MKVLPIGVPKVMVSTLASGNTRHFVGGSDITMVHPLVDIAGLNGLLIQIPNNAAGAIVGMLTQEPVRDTATGREVIGATQFGVTTPCLDAARAVLERAGFEVVAFHASGAGGESFKSLVRDGAFAGVLDVNTTELADELLGGIHSAGPTRLEAGAAAGLPQVVSVGALDMCDFGPPATIPPEYRDRRFVKHNPHITPMRTTTAENIQLGRSLAARVNKASGPVHLFLPLRGVSAIDAPGKPFHDPEADAVLFETIKNEVDPAVVRVIELDAHINDAEFAVAMADDLIGLVRASRRPELQEVQ